MPSKRLLPAALGAAALCALAIVAVGRPSSAASGSANPGTLTVTGQSTLSVAPDEAQIGVGTDLIAATAAAAMNDDTTRVAAIVAALEKDGVAANDIQTQGYNLSPNTTQSSANAAPRISGYSISDTLTLTTTDLAAVGRLIDAAVSAGANQVNGVNFVVSDESALQNRANASALAQARSQAAYLAAAAGEHLGPLLSLSVNQGSSTVFATASAAYGAVHGPMILPPSSLQVSADLTAVYRLLP